MQGCWWRRPTVKAGRQSLLPHPIFDEDSMHHKQRLATAVGASVQGDDVRRLLTMITDASFKKRTCNATRFTTAASIRSARLFWLQFSEKNCICFRGGRAARCNTRAVRTSIHPRPPSPCRKFNRGLVKFCFPFYYSL